MRVESPKRLRNGGFLHRLCADSAWRDRRRTRSVAIAMRCGPGGGTNFSRLAERYRAAVNQFDLIRLAADLGVDHRTLIRLGIGWDGQAWTFPMRDADGRVTGIRRRLPDGRKLSVRGGREGLFVPDDLPASGVLLIAEGPTDTAALLGLEFAAIGRPSCRGGVRLVCELTRGREIVVVSDNDWNGAGQRGAAALASVMRVHCRSVRLIHPPDGAKDARAWVSAGATRADLLEVIGRTNVLSLAVSANHGC